MEIEDQLATFIDSQASDNTTRNVDAILDNMRGKSEKIINWDIDLKNWKVTSLYKDVLLIKRLDEPTAMTVIRRGIHMPTQSIKGAFSLGEVLLTGPDVKTAKVGDVVTFPSQLGVDAMRAEDGYKTYFLSESQVMAVVSYVGAETIAKDIEDTILLKS